MTKREIIARLDKLPKGGITSKKIKKPGGKEYIYHFLQWREEGKQKNKSIKEGELEEVRLLLEERKKLERMLSLGEYEEEGEEFSFFTQVTIGNNLLSLVEHVKGFRKRSGFKDLSRYVYGEERGKVFILYGLRRTGKTTLIHQLIEEMDNEALSKTAFLQITRKDDFALFNKDMRVLQENGYRYIFVDEITLMNDFIEGAALLSDIYASSGMKIVLSGTDSLGFYIGKSNELYDRCILLHTTYISYSEFSYVLGINGIDDYIEYGGTMSVSGRHYNVFENKGSTDEYIDSSIAKNIQHSLRNYQYEGHFRHLYDLYQKGELTGAINRVVEDINHRFTLEVLERKFKSSDYRISANNLRKDRSSPTTILDDIDIASFTSRLKDMLEIKDKEERIIDLDDIHVAQIEEYLTALDLIETIDVVSADIDKPDGNRVIFTQPGLRYSQAKSLILSLSSDPLFKNLALEERNRVVERILSEIKGRMAEDIVLLETKIAFPKKRVFKLFFANGEFDMVVSDPLTLESEIYEIKYSKEALKEQARHLLDEEKCNSVSRRFGRIKKKGVIYRGDSLEKDGIEYQNIEEYLLGLSK